MDAKSKANFINSVANGQMILCPSCNAENEADSMFCYSCGAKMETGVEQQEAIIHINDAEVETPASSAFPSISRPSVSEQTESASGEHTKTDINTETSVYQSASPSFVVEEEPMSVFALGLPPWDIVPPQVMVRRKRR